MSISVDVFQWVVGICGLIKPSHIDTLFKLASLGIPNMRSKAEVEPTALAAVKALDFMHQVRFGGMHGRKRSANDQLNNTSNAEANDDEELRTDPTGKRRSNLMGA
jgi:hypothetical protein